LGNACWRGLLGGRTHAYEKLAEITMNLTAFPGANADGPQPHERDPPRPILPVEAVRFACIVANYARACVSLCSVYLSANQPRGALGRGVQDVDRKRTTHSCSRSDATLVPPTQTAVGANAQPHYDVADVPILGGR